MPVQECPCGSGLWPDQQYDGYNIFLCYTCEQCEKAKMARYRPDIHTHYECDEPIEEE